MKTNDTQEKAMEGQRKTLRILVGDDQIGVPGSLQQSSFLRNYSRIVNASFDFECDSERFIERSRDGRYDALLIDLNWTDEDIGRKDKTGFRVLEAVRGYAPIRILHTSDEDNMKKGLNHGATGFAEKHRSSEYMEKILKGEA